MKSIVTLTGMTCSGKSSLASSMSSSGNYKESVSFTTRPMRRGETDGVSYNFISSDSAKEMYLSGDILESTNVGGYGYGTAKSAVESIMELGKTPVVVCDPHGVESIHNYAAEQGWRHTAIFMEAKRVLWRKDLLTEAFLIEHRFSKKGGWERLKKRTYIALTII